MAPLEEPRTPVPLRVVLADDERPARSYLATLLRGIGGVTIVGEAANGAEAVQLIELHRPELALLDLQMPEVDGLSVARLVRKKHLPLLIFVTAYDEHAVKAFELNAVDYLTKPVSETRLRQALRRARDRFERQDRREAAAASVHEAIRDYDRAQPETRLSRIPVRHGHDIVLLAATQLAAVVADGESLHLSTLRHETYKLTFRLKDLEARLDPARFIRLGRGTLVNIEAIGRITPIAGGMYRVSLVNGQELNVSRIQSRRLRRRLLQL